MEGIYLETTFLCMYTLLYKHQKIWNEAQYTLNFKSFSHKSASVFLIQVYIFPFIEYSWIVFQYIIMVKSEMDLEKELVLHLQVLLFLLIEFEWINYFISPPPPWNQQRSTNNFMMISVRIEVYEFTQTRLKLKAKFGNNSLQSI